MKKWLMKAGVFAAVLGGLFIYSSIDRAVNYKQVTARVTGVEEACYLKKVERGLRRKTTSTTKEGPCEVIRLVQQSKPDLQDFELVKVTYVSFEYRSPADGNTYGGRHKQSRHKDGRQIKPGDNLPVKAHKEDPQLTTHG